MKSKTRATRFGIAFLVTVIVMISALCVSAFAAEVQASDEASLVAALNGAATDGTETTVKVTADIVYTGATAINIPDGANVVICADEPHTLTYKRTEAGQGYTFINVGTSSPSKGGTTLTVTENITLDGDSRQRPIRIYQGKSAKHNALILDGATLQNGNAGGGGSGGAIYAYYSVDITMKNGAEIKNCVSGTTSSAGTGGGGIYVGGLSSTGSYTAQDTANITIDGAKITGCTSNGNYGGGGIYYESAGVIDLANCEISGNTVTLKYGGAGMLILRSGNNTNATVTVNIKDGTKITGNSVTNDASEKKDSSFGGGIRFNANVTVNMSGGEISGNSTIYRGGGVSVNGGTFNMTGGTIKENTAKAGGGVFVHQGTFELSGTGKVSGNTATTYGGGVGLGYSSNGAWFNMKGGEVSDNTADTFGGGVCSAYGFFNMSGGEISGNYAELYGGGVAGVAGTGTSKATATSTVNVTGGSVIGNKTGEGGDGAGFGFYANSKTDPYFITNCTISGNISGKNGGAICVNATSTNLTPVVVTSCTISENYANGYGGVAYSNGDLSIADTEIYDNKSKSLIFDIAGSGYGGQLYMKNVTAYGNASNVLRDAESGEYSFKDSRTSAGSVLYCEGTTETTVEDCVFFGNEGASAVQASGSASVKFVGNTEVYDNVLNGKYDDALGYYVFDTENTKCQYRDVTLANGELLFDLGSEANIKIPQTDFRLSEDGIFKIGTIFDGNDEISGISSSADAELGAVLDTDGVTVIWDNSTLVALTLDSPNSAYSTTLFAPYADVSYQLPKQSEIKSLFDADDLVFVGYADVTNYGTAPTLVGLYDEDATFTADQLNGEKLYATWTDLKTVDGDSVRVGEDTSKIGLRFFATIDAEPLKAIGITNTDEGIGFGLGMRVYYKDSEGNLTQKEFFGYGKDLDEEWAGEQYFEELGGLKAYAFGLNLSEAEYEYDFTPVAFIKVTYGEKEGSTVSSKSAYSKSTAADDVKGYDYKSARQTAIEWVEMLTDEKWDAMSEKQFANLQKVVGEGYETSKTAGGKNKLVKPE